MRVHREVYRDRKGRFVRRAALFHGPFLPNDHPIMVERKRLLWEGIRLRFLEDLTKPNQMFNYLKDRGRVREHWA